MNQEHTLLFDELNEFIQTHKNNPSMLLVTAKGPTITKYQFSPEAYDLWRKEVAKMEVGILRYALHAGGKHVKLEKLYEYISANKSHFGMETGIGKQNLFLYFLRRNKNLFAEKIEMGMKNQGKYYRDVKCETEYLPIEYVLSDVFVTLLRKHLPEKYYTKKIGSAFTTSLGTVSEPMIYDPEDEDLGNKNQRGWE